MGNLQNFYKERIQHFQIEKKKTANKLRIIGFLRLLSFLCAIVIFILFISTKPIWASLSLVGFLVLFFILVRKYQNISSQNHFLLLMIEQNEKELLATSHQFDQFADGNSFINPDHFNSYDLDLFGKGSLFQFIDRTGTSLGNKQLADWLIHPILEKKGIENRQGLITELLPLIDWRQGFTANALRSSLDSENQIDNNWKSPFEAGLFFVRAIPVIIPVLVAFSLFGLLYWVFAGISGWFILSSVLQVVFWGLNRKPIKETSVRLGKQLDTLVQIETMFLAIEQTQWQSDEAIGKRLALTANGAPSKQINRLRKLTSAFDNRYNILVGLVLNLIFCWDVWCTLRFHRWHNDNDRNIKTWFDTLAFFDAANSLANFSFNHRGYVFPKVVENGFCLKTQEIGHPLINPDKRVCNDFAINEPSLASLITGANMSGKSTFLRTIGVNLVLAMAGAPVCAREMEFTPVEVFSNMRNTDSLFNDESYFFAELKRLKQVLDELSGGRKILILLDEILKGTNSIDKLNGSKKVLERLIKYKAPALVATHDLKLTEMEARYPGNLKNYCFEIEIENDEMKFDYQLRQGVTQVMNATFLMKRMGIIEQA